MNERLNEEIIFSAASVQENMEIIDADWKEDCGLALILLVNKKAEVLINETKLPVPLLFPNFAFIRWIDYETILIAAYENKNDEEKTVYLVKKSGEVLQSFYGGEAIQDIVVGKEGVWVSYFDEGVFGSGISKEGLVLFDFYGKVLFKYHSDLLDRPFAADCYALVKGKGSEIWLFPYTDFPLVAVNPKDRSSRSYPIPEMLHGSNSMSIRGKYAYFYSPYDFEQNVYQLEIGKQEPLLLGTIRGIARGLNPSQGRHFISVAEHEVILYQVINEDEYHYR